VGFAAIAVMLCGTSTTQASQTAVTTYESCRFSGVGTFAEPLTSPVKWDRLHIRGRLSRCSGKFKGHFPVKGTVKAYYPSCTGPGSYNQKHVDLSVNHITIAWSSTSQTIIQPMSWNPRGTDIQDMTGAIASGPFAGPVNTFRAIIDYTLVGSCTDPPMTGITFSASMVTFQNG
jgi:hypothetical protein